MYESRPATEARTMILPCWRLGCVSGVPAAADCPDVSGRTTLFEDFL
jgi:hypothetical protein